MALDLRAIRHQLILLARRKKCRKRGWPNHWRPTGVTNPADGNPFTQDGAWEFIAELLENGIDFEHKILDEPEEGANAYVIEKSLGDRILYIKLQLGSGCVIGRSFHYSCYD